MNYYNFYKKYNRNYALEGDESSIDWVGSFLAPEWVCAWVDAE